MQISLRNQFLISGALAFILVGVFWLGYEEGIFSILRIVVGSVFLLFLPGYWLTRVFFQKKEIDELERFVLSFALSISLVPLFVFYLNLTGIPITQWLVLGVGISIMIGSFGWLWWKKVGLKT